MMSHTRFSGLASLAVLAIFGAPSAAAGAPATRRALVGRCFALVSAPLLVRAEGIESIRQAAASIPGYGQPDIYYPPAFRGRRIASRHVFDVSGLETPGLATVAEEARRLAAGDYILYDVRFIVRDEHIIADRGWNAETFMAAVRVGAGSDTIRPSADWSASNPNILTLRDGLRLVEFKVTRRAVEQPMENAFGASEYERVADAGSDGILAAVPLIQARRVETRYRWALPPDGQPVSTIEVLERVSWFDPTKTGFADLKSASPSLVVKSRIEYARVRSTS
ncbi:hypothetical protein T492DRAFT_1019684 [Pavlovales sp. CCMP2436]|nr:hypothetical protein T492DRAFT_1019684 [Pavlovales sp. CCMP2436]